MWDDLFVVPPGHWTELPSASHLMVVPRASLVRHHDERAEAAASDDT
jgi:hypothetical protein